MIFSNSESCQMSTPSFLANKSGVINCARPIFLWLFSVGLFKGHGVSEFSRTIHTLTIQSRHQPSPVSQKPNAKCRTFFFTSTKCLFCTDIMSNILLFTRHRDKRLSSFLKHPDCGRIIYSQGGQKYPTPSKRKEG